MLEQNCRMGIKTIQCLHVKSQYRMNNNPNSKHQLFHYAVIFIFLNNNFNIEHVPVLQYTHAHMHAHARTHAVDDLL